MRTLFLGIAIGAALVGLLWLWSGSGGRTAGDGPPAGPPERIVARASTAPADLRLEPGAPPPADLRLERGAPPAAGGGVEPPSTSAGTPSGTGPSSAAIIDSARLDPSVVRAAPSTVPQKGGQLSSESVRVGVAAANPAVKKCYEEALVQKPDLGGKLLVEFVIAQEGGRGRIREADIDEAGTDEAMLNPFLGMCVLKALGEVEFDPPTHTGGDGEIVVRFPFHFENRPGDPAEAP
jgi:hypothetical protein